MKNYLSISIASILVFSASGIAKAQSPFTITAAIGGVPTVSGATLENFDEPSPSILTLSGSAYLVTGANYGVAYVPPCFSGSTAAFFGESTMIGYNNYPWDGSQYVAVWDGGSATLGFSTPQNYFGLLWGTVGAGDSLTFYDGANKVGTVLGSDVPTPFSDGGWGPNDTYYVSITSTTAFSRVVATETATPSFEFDDVAYAVVPEPASSILFGAGFCIFGLALRQKFGTNSRKI